MVKNDKPLVSIVVPVYGVEKYIDECIESIVSQTYSNIEVILVDDASPDNSGKKCDEWSKKDNRIKVVHKQKNEGLFQARVTGYEAMAGDYFMTVDSDDYIAHDSIEKFLAKSISSDADIVVSNILTTFDDSNKDQIEFSKIYSTSNVLDNFMKNIANKKYGWSAYNKLYKISVYEKAKTNLLSIKRNINASEDLLFATIFAYYANKSVYLDGRGGYYFYRQNPESIMRKISDELLAKKLDDVTAVFFEIERFLASVNILDKYYNRVSLVRRWHLSENILLIEDVSRAELQQHNTQLQQSNAELQQHNTQLQQSNAELQQHIKDIITSKTYRVGQLVAYPYIKIKNIVKSFRQSD